MKWEKEADVVIVGFGGAGASAAIVAHELGARVLVLEKSAQGGGNTQYAAGSLRTFADKSKAVEHYYLLCEGTTGKDVLTAFVEEASRSPDWLRQHGAELLPVQAEERSKRFPRSFEGSAFPMVSGAEGVGSRLYVTRRGTVKGGGANLWAVVSSEVAAGGIEVLANHRADRLIIGKQRQVIGVEADGPAGKMRAMARRAVVLACGGFENHPRMQLDYLGAHFYPIGTEANAGDGVTMAMEVGADLWHMNAVPSVFGYKAPEYDAAFPHAVPGPGFIYVDQNGRRFMDEASIDMHTGWIHVCHIDLKTTAKPRVPSYLIFDEETRRSGPISNPGKGRAGRLYQWSNDNLAEVERGWIVRGGTVAELSEKIGMDSGALQETVDRYNTACARGYDPEYQRPADSLSPVARPPYYAIPLWPATTHTLGGPRRNSKAQVLDTRGNPIRRLYSAGELGSIWGRFYPGAANVSEAIAFGRIAGRNAATEPPWE